MSERGPASTEDFEEEGLDWSRIARTTLWGVLAITMSGAAVLAASSDKGSRRLASLLGGESSQAEIQQAQNVQIEAEARRLAEQVQSLGADRDRLLARLETLERQFEDVTGAIQRDGGVTTPQPATAAAPMPLPSGLSAYSLPGASAEIVRSPEAESVVTRTEFGIDLGGDSSIEGLRTLWTNLKTSHAKTLDGLRPVAAIREGKKPGSIELRLVAGPLANAAAAAQLCASLASANQPCQPSVFDGQRLALR